MLVLVSLPCVVIHNYTELHVSPRKVVTSYKKFIVILKRQDTLLNSTASVLRKSFQQLTLHLCSLSHLFLSSPPIWLFQLYLLSC